MICASRLPGMAWRAEVGAIHVGLRPSRLLAAVLGLAGAGACVVLAILPFPWWSKAAMGAFLLLCTVYHIARSALLRLPGAIVALEVSAKNGLSCLPRGGEWLQAEVLGDSYVTPWLSVLVLQLPGKRFARHAVILPDMLDADSYRRLRVWLRWRSQKPS